MSEVLGNLFVIAAPSGTGKTTLVKALIEKFSDDIALSISHTTRDKRDNEIDGVDYHFISQTEFQKLLDRRDFLEYAQVYNHYYGTSRSWVEQQLKKGIDVVLEIDWQGAKQIKKMYEASQHIFILPPSVTVLRERLHLRGQDSVDTINNRMRVVREEISKYINFDYIVVNDNFDLAVSQLYNIIEARRLIKDKQSIRQLRLINDLLNENFIGK